MTILITGASGFLGGAIVDLLCQKQIPVRAIVHRNRPAFPTGVEVGVITSLNASTSWSGVLKNVSAVVHCAARVHVMRDDQATALEACRQINTEGTLNLAHQAATAGVTRFLFISTIGVHGAETENGPFHADSPASPQTPYAQSKWEAEEGLREIARDTGMEIVIIRPPLIYGKDAPGNFTSLLSAVNRYLPLPLGAVHNHRSFAAVENVADLVLCCLEHSAAANQAFLVSDGDDLSTSAFIRKIATVQGKVSMLIPVPVALMAGIARLVGKEETVHKLTCSLYVDIQKNNSLLGWHPIIGVEEGLRKATSR